MMHYNNNNSMDPEAAAYWLDRAKAEVSERDALIQNQRNEIDRLTRTVQELNYNGCMRNAIIAYEVKRFAQQRAFNLPMSSPQNQSGGSMPVVSLSELDSFLSQLTEGILETTASSSPQTSQMDQQQQQYAQGQLQQQQTSAAPSNPMASRLREIQQRFAKRCRDEHDPDLRPMRPGQWNQQQVQDVYS